MSRLRDVARQVARRSDRVQDAYEAQKNRRRGTVLRQLLPPGGVGAELGVHKGHLTEKLLVWLEPKKLYVVDPWYLLTPTWDWAAGNKSTVHALRRVLKRIRPWLEAGTAEVVVADDLRFLANLDDASLDWVYLDSSHMYEHTLQELELLVAKVRHGGVIAGDDWQPEPTHRHHGVYRAVRQFEEAGRIRVIYGDQRDHQWAAEVVST